MAQYQVTPIVLEIKPGSLFMAFSIIKCAKINTCRTAWLKQFKKVCNIYMLHTSIGKIEFIVWKNAWFDSLPVMQTPVENHLFFNLNKIIE